MKAKQFIMLLLAGLILSACEKSVKLSAPSGVQGQQLGNTIVLSWNRVDGAVLYYIHRDGMYLGSSPSTNYTDTHPRSGYNSYEVSAANSESRSQSTSINVFFDDDTSSGGNGGGGSNPGGNTEQESVVISTPVISNITSSSATIKYNLEYSSATITDAGIMYARTSNYDYQYVSVGSANVVTLQKSNDGNYTITINLNSLNPETQYSVKAFVSTSKSAYTSDEKRFTTSYDSSSGGNGGTGELAVNKTNLTGTWKCTFNGGDEYYWVLQSSGTAYSIVDESSYWTTGSYHKFVGTWTVSSSSFTFKQTKHYYYEGGTLDSSETESDTETVSVRSLTSSFFVDGDGNTWTKTTLPSYVKL